MVKKKKTAKATRSEKLVPEKVAFEHLCYFASKVIAGNRITRNMVGDFLDDIEDDECAKVYLQTVTMLVVQDESQRQEFLDHFEGEDFAMDLYNLAVDIREVLGLNGFDDLEADI